MINGLYVSDYEMIKNSLHDRFAQPYRKQLIPFYDDVEKLVTSAGAYGFNISGSGPTMFAFFKEEDDLGALKLSILKVYERKTIKVRFHESSINKRGVEVI
ncbi:MAG: homoserine kinase [Roseivirga sp.]